MYHINMIQKTLDYIEDNLKSELSITELADLAGYSLYHYERIFKRLVGISIARYIKRRRLLHAAFDIASGSKIIDTAYRYGFDTNAGFYKAFVREFGEAPTEYVLAHTVKRPYRIKLIQEEHLLITHVRIFDPCYAATAILSATYEDSTLDRDKWPEILRKIIAGYNAVAQLTEAERAAIPYMIYSIQMTCIAFFSEFERYRALADTNTQMLKWLIQEEAWKKVV